MGLSSLFCVLSLGALSFAQAVDTPQVVTEADARQHVLQQERPHYPKSAIGSRIQGVVGVAIVIDVTGRVVSERIVGGPPILQQAVLDAVKNWRFAPFATGGSPTPVTTVLTFAFSVGDSPEEGNQAQWRAAHEWLSLSEKCRSALTAQNAQDSLDYCKRSLDTFLLARDLTADDWPGLLDSCQFYGRALLLAGRLQEALKEENAAVDIAKWHLKNTDQVYAMPFYWRAMAEEGLGRGDAALADLSLAEETHRRAIKQHPEAKEIYSRLLIVMLNHHAALLDQMGRAAEAASLRTEAASYIKSPAGVAQGKDVSR